MKEHRILITGAGGMLGREVVRACRRRSTTVAGRSRSELDITDEAGVAEAIEAFSPTVLINCAAYTDVDGAESNEDAAMRANAAGPEILASACAGAAVLFVHLSTDYVFDGAADRPIPADAAPNPINAYGRSKREGERAVLASGAQSMIIRTSWLYAAHGANFVRTMMRLGSEQPSLRVVNDQHGRPTLCDDLAEAVCGLIEADARGILHVANAGSCTWYEFALEIMKRARLDCRVEPCPTHAFPRPAKRPAFAVLDLSVAHASIGPLRAWPEALAACIEKIMLELVADHAESI